MKGADRLSEVVENELDIKDPETEWYGDITLSSLTSHNLELMSSIARDLDELEERRALDADVFWVAATIGTETNSRDAHSAALRLLDAQWLKGALKRQSLKNSL